MALTYLLMVGIAAGFEDKVDLGDVVVVAKSCYYDGLRKNLTIPIQSYYNLVYQLI